MKDDLDIKNLNSNIDSENDDTLYFGDVEKDSYESQNKPYTEEDMYEDYKPLTNTNSVEYDDGDYASPLYGIDREEVEAKKKVIFAYIFALLAIVLFVVVVMFVF